MVQPSGVSGAQRFHSAIWASDPLFPSLLLQPPLVANRLNPSFLPVLPKTPPKAQAPAPAEPASSIISRIGSTSTGDPEIFCSLG